MLQLLQAYQAAINEAAIVSITDLKGIIVYVNRKFTEISRYQEAELIGKSHRIVNSGYHPPAFFSNMWRSIASGQPWRGEIKNKTKDGAFYWVDTVITPVLDHAGNIFQYLSVRNLITSQKENEEKLLRIQNDLTRQKQQLKDAQEVAKTGSWHLDIESNQLEWSEETYQIFGIATGTTMTYEAFLHCVHPDERELVNSNWEMALAKGAYAFDHRIITPGRSKWVSERARVVFSKNGQPVFATGTVQDITEKKKTEETLKDSESLYKNLFNNSPFAVGIMQKESLRFLEVNQTAIELYGYSREAFLQLTAYDIRVEEGHANLTRELASGNYSGNKSIRVHRKKNGDLLQVEPSITEMNYRGQAVFLITITDMTEKLRIQKELSDAKLMWQKAIVDAQEQSRSEIGMELHDNVNQLLVASSLYLKSIHPSRNSDRERIRTVLNIIADATREIRKLSASLVPPALNFTSLKESIELLETSFELAGIIARFTISINEAKLEEGLKINIYRIIQEQLNNIIKYAGATEVNISLLEKTEALVLEIADNGKGFDLKEKTGGIGLANIIYRAEAYNGRAAIETAPGRGCRITVAFVLSPPDNRPHAIPPQSIQA